MTIPKTISIDNEVYVRKADLPSEPLNSDIKIVILQRGWVVIGRWNQKNSHVTLTDASVIRRWGTSRGLGQLALEGKQDGTILDRAGTIEFHELTVVATFNVDGSKWPSL